MITSILDQQRQIAQHGAEATSTFNEALIRALGQTIQRAPRSQIGDWMHDQSLADLFEIAGFENQLKQTRPLWASSFKRLSTSKNPDIYSVLRTLARRLEKRASAVPEEKLLTPASARHLLLVLERLKETERDESWFRFLVRRAEP